MSGHGFSRVQFPAALAAVVCLTAWSAQAFGTANLLGQNAEHEKITRLALAGQGFERKSLDELAGKGGTFGAVGAPDNPARIEKGEGRKKTNQKFP